MSKDDEAERKAFGGIIPARPKGAPGPTPPPKGAWNPLDDMLKQAGRQTMQGPARLDFVQEEEQRQHPPITRTDDTDPFEAFVEFMRILRKLPRKQQKAIIEIIADLID